MTEKSRAEYEKRLQEELAAIRQRAHLDLEDVRKNTREFYEREIMYVLDMPSTLDSYFVAVCARS